MRRYVFLLLFSAPVLGADDKFPPELVHFRRSKKEPVFAGDAKGKWDERIRERGWILREGENDWKLWYTGYDGTKDGLRMLGLATSKDGVAWTRHPANPLDRTNWIEDMMVIKDKETYLMFAEGKGDRAHWFTSKDGVAWVRQGQLNVRLKNGEPIPDGPYGTPTVWREKDKWYLFYERNDDGIWLAASSDLKVWQNVQDEPVLSPGPEEYDREQVALNQIVKHKGRYYAYYHGSAKSGPKAKLWSTAIATSTDLLHWEKYKGNPLLPVEENKSSGIVVHDGKEFRLYTMHPSVILHMPATKDR